MVQDTYAGFAGRYDLAFGQFDEFSPDTIAFFRRLFAEHGVRTVLDCACGTGRHLLLFHSLGCEVAGSDLSEATLIQARENLGEHGLQLPLTQADYRSLPQYFPQPFDAVVCWGGIGYMPDEAEFLRAFQSMAGVLRAGGILVLNAQPTDRQWAEKPRFLLAANTRDFSRLYAVDYLARSARYHVLDVFHSEEASGLEVWSAELTTLLRDDQERLLRAAGFRTVDFFGSLDFEPYDNEMSRRLIAVAKT